MKALALAAGLMAGFFMPTYAQESDVPRDVISRTVRMQIFCVGSMVRMATLLGDKFGEAPVAMGRLNDTDSFLIFVDKYRSTSTIVIAKQRKEEVEVCMVWSGRTEPGLTFSLNPSPQFPEQKEFGT